MDQRSTLDRNLSPPAADATPHVGSNVSVMATPAAAAAMHGAESSLQFPRDEGIRTLAQLAQRDLDAALQLLAERAQYITGATGAAIALRRGGHHDLLCRASAGSNAPSLGALLSAESGLSGESVRARLALRCDDTERDPRVNREGCRALGIASVAVIPIVTDDQVLGVFELFSGKLNAFDERDVSALQRLGEMVETAVKLVPAEPSPEVQGQRPDLVTWAEPVAEAGTVAEEPPRQLETAVSLPVGTLPVPAAPATAAPAPAAEQAPAEQAPAAATPPSDAVAPPKPLFWTAAAAPPNAAAKAEADQSQVPAVLRNLHKCHACGFPVSEGRLLCVECEEKRWRGQLRSTAAQYSNAAAADVPITAAPAVNAARVPEVASRVTPAQRADSAVPARKAPASTSAPVSAGEPESAPSGRAAHSVAPQLPSGSSHKVPAPLLFGAGSAPSESWLSKNKYVLGAVVLVAIVALVIALVH